MKWEVNLSFIVNAESMYDAYEKVLAGDYSKALVVEKGIERWPSALTRSMSAHD